MKNTLSFVFAFLLLTTAALAKDDPPFYDEITLDHVWQAIETHDFEAAERIFAASYAHVRATQGESDHTRWLFGIFGTSSPNVAQFAEDWVTAYPDSAFAHNALTWVYYSAGYDVRGNRFANRTHSDAHAVFLRFHFKALEHAKRAYALEPDLLPASDAFIRLAVSTRTKGNAREVIDRVMKEDPNMGTLLRAIEMTNPGWGGTWSDAKKLCRTYAPMIRPEEKNLTIDECILYATGITHLNKKKQYKWYQKEAAKREFPDQDWLYARNIPYRNATEEQAEFLNEYLSRPDVTNFKLAKEFDNKIAVQHGYDFHSEAHFRRARESAKSEIERDPYNAELLEFLIDDVMGYSYIDNVFKISVVERTPIEVKRKYTRRLLQMSPYDPDLWKAYAKYRFDPRNPDHLLLDEPYFINRIFYSDHRSEVLSSYLFSRWQILSQIERIEWEMETPAWKAQTLEQLAHSTKIAEGLIAKRETMDLDKHLRCPMMRVYRLYTQKCGAVKDTCSMHPQVKEMLQIIQSDVNERGVCKSVMASQIEDLYFTPVDIDLSE